MLQNFFKKFKSSEADGLSDWRELYNFVIGRAHLGSTEQKCYFNGPKLMRNLFIPHQGNDYQPQVLHHKRVLFYAASALIIKAIVFIAVVAYPIQSWLAPDVFREEVVRIINLTNEIRNNLNLPKLTESLVLDQAAYTKAMDMFNKQYFAHFGPDNNGLEYWLKLKNYDYLTAGENLALGYSTADEAVSAWTKSRTHYANMIDPDFTEIGVGVATGNFGGHDTAMIAQYFGRPNKKSLVANNITIPKNKILETKNKKAVLAANIASNNGNKNALAPSEPIILLAEDKIITKNSEVQFKVFAPGAALVKIYDNHQNIIAEGVVARSNYVSFNLNLSEGEHNLTAMAYNGSASNPSANKIFIIDKTPPAINHSKSNIEIINPSDPVSNLVRVEAFVGPDTIEAEAFFGGQYMRLKKDAFDSNKWVGRKIIFHDEKEQMYSPLVLASIRVTDQAGNESYSDIKWQNIMPLEQSLSARYLAVRQGQPQQLSLLFSVSSLYYKILLILAIIFLLINVFVQIRKQHIHIILPVLGFILLVGALILS